MKKRVVLFLTAFVLAFASIVMSPKAVFAAEKISVSEIDYDELTMHVNVNGNKIIYFSTDAKKTWNELEGIMETDASGKKYKLMDISWASVAADVTVCFKGDINQEVTEVTIPKQNADLKVKYDKATGEFEFIDNDGFDEFLWRKSTDYSWQSVPFNQKSSGYAKFLKQIDALKYKGAKIVIRVGQIEGKNQDDMGERPGKDIVIAIPKRASAPAIKVNVAKMTLNTKDTMEYYDSKTKSWITCKKTMTVEEIAPNSLLSNGSETTTVKIRVAETEKKPYSLSKVLVIPGQTAAPVIGKAVDCSIEDSKLKLSFITATKEAPIEYCIVKPEEEFTESKAKWRTINANKVVALTEKNAPNGTEIYFRYKGIAENVNKGVALVLPSGYCSYSVSWSK